MRKKSSFITGALTLYLGGEKTEVKITGIRYQVTLKSRDLWFGFLTIYSLFSTYSKITVKIINRSGSFCIIRMRWLTYKGRDKGKCYRIVTYTLLILRVKNI